MERGTDNTTSVQQSAQPRPFAFVLMPFDRDFDDVYALAIRPACVAAGAYCERVDEQIFGESILDRIYNQINKADVVIADVTGRNPNVFYEVGYAHALGRPTILLTQRESDIPFDLKHYQHIIYGGRLADLKAALEPRVRWHLSERGPKQLAADLTYYLGAAKIDPGSEHLLQFDYETGGTLAARFMLGIHNPGPKAYVAEDDQIGIILPPEFRIEDVDLDTETDPIILPNGRWMSLYRGMRRIPPQGWEQISGVIRVPKQAWKDAMPATIRVYTAVGPHDTSFVIRTTRVARSDA